MSNTLNKPTDNQPTKPSNSSSPPSYSTSTKSKKTVQVIVGEIGRDSKTGILGRGYSYDNGKTFHVLDTMYGRLYGDDDIEAIWIHGVSDRVKSEVNSATAEIPAVESAANEGVRKAENAIASSKVNSDAVTNMKSAVSAVKSDASAAASDAIKNLNDVKSATSSAYQELYSSVASNQVILDSTSKSLDGLATDLSKYAQDAVSQGKTIAELKQNQSDVSATVASVEGNVNQLKVDTKNIQATASDNKSDIANLQISASSTSVAIKDANSNVAVAVATASQASVELQDTKRNIAAVQATAETMQATMANAKSDIDSLKIDAEGIHQTLTGQGNQIATINTTLDGLNTKYEGVSGDLSNLSNKAMQNRGTVNSPDFNSLTQAGYYTVTNPINGKNFPIGNWGTLEVSGQVSDINGRLNQKYVGDNGGGTYTRQYNASAKSWTGWLKEANQNDVTALSNRITTNSTQITQNKQAIALKASQTSVNDLANSVNSQSASLTVMNNAISTKVTSADVEKAINGKRYVTKDFVESSITQKANTLSESIASVNGQVQNVTASLDGLQSTVKGKADMSKVTQLADALQFKVTGVYIAQTDLLKLTKNDVASESVLTGPQLNNLASVVKGAKVQLSFDYVTDSDIGFYPILTGAPNEFVGSYPFGAGTIYAQKGVKGTYSKTITVNDGWVDSKETNLAFAAFNNGTITFTNLVLKLADSTKGDAQSMFNIMQDQMNLRVTKDNLISQINLSAGNTLIQSNKIFLDADSVVFSKNSKAFIPSAAITDLEADKITTGTLNGVEIRQLETGGRSIDIKNGNIAITSHDPYEPRISFTNDGKNMKMFNALGDLEVINQEFSLFNFTPDDTSSTNPIPFFRVVNTGNTGSGSAHLYMDHAIIDGNEWWTPAGGITFGRTWDGTNASSDYVDLYAKSFVPHSELSAKTRIKKLDRKEALDKIMQDDMYTYQFKEDVRDGVSKRYASFIIDNVHGIAQYAEPEEFLSANGKGRDDGTQLAYLIAAVQYQQEQIEELKKKLEEK